MTPMSAANEANRTEPTISIIKGDPTAEEIAALVIVLAGSAGAGPTAPSSAGGGQWAAYWRRLRTPIPPGPGSWRQSARS